MRAPLWSCLAAAGLISLAVSCGAGTNLNPLTVQIYATNQVQVDPYAYVRGNVYQGCTNGFRLLIGTNLAVTNAQGGTNFIAFRWASDPRPSQYLALPPGRYFFAWAAYSNAGSGDLGPLWIDPSGSNGYLLNAGTRSTVLITNGLTNDLNAVLSNGIGGTIFLQDFP